MIKKTHAHMLAAFLVLVPTACDSKGSSPQTAATSAPPAFAAAPAEKMRTAVVLARVKGLPNHVAVDATSVYATVEDWTRDDLPTDIVRIPLAGGEPTVLASKQRGGQSLVATKDALFRLAEGDVDKDIPDAVMTVRLSGGAPSKLGKTFLFADAGLAADSSYVYFQDLAEKGTSRGRLMRAPVGGGKAELVANFDDASAHVITVDAKNVYWMSLGTILKAPLGGGSATPLVKDTGVGNVWGIASDGTHLYWTDRGNWQNDEARTGAVHRISIDGGAVQTIARGLRGRPWGIALDATHAYWVINAERDGGIMRAPKAGGPASIVVGGQSSPVHLALDSSNVYWTSSGVVSKAPKEPPK